ncbi:LysR substrate-binding domain-containing protein [Streptomyces sp. NBC_00663]|uniref:LysR substrate-binding domain-containing protein n=1 Tax=Streptomyces sp. NBC_00663 TaxID=2975801 RepID=UPI002E336EA5|nr:LysR substrate-binding domain-containing protein [Streptomyces sp. NBC_00663]
MDVQVLRSFRAVAEGATVTHAAAEAHLTQPALSRALRRLEREVGAELFQQVGRVLRLTPAGQVFKEHVDAALDRIDHGLRAVRETVSPESGLIPLAFLHSLGTWLLPPLITGYRERFPLARFELRQGGEAVLLQALLDGTADLLLTAEDPGHALVTWRRLLVEPLWLAVPPGHRLAQRRRARLSEVADEPFIMLRHEQGLRAVTEALCRKVGYTPRAGFEGDEVATLRGLVAAGLGVSLLPRPHSAAPPPSRRAPTYLQVTDVEASRDIGIAWLSSRTLPANSRRFIDHALEHAAAVARQEQEHGPAQET